MKRICSLLMCYALCVMPVANFGCAASIPVEHWQDSRYYTIQIDQFGRYRVLWPDGDESGWRGDSYQEADNMLQAMVNVARRVYWEMEIEGQERKLDAEAKWNTLKHALK